MQIELAPAPVTSKPDIANMLQPYLRELAPYFGGSNDPETIYDYPYLDAYWNEPDDRFPFLILADEQIAGFAFVNRHSRLNTSDTRSIAEFYVIPKFRSSGIGTSAAKQIFNRFSGNWEVAILHGNTSAERFWKRSISNLNGISYTEQRTDSWNGSILTFNIPGS